MKIKKGDTIYILAGKDRGKSGKVLRITDNGERALIDGLNMYKKHSRPKRQGEKGEIVSVPRPLQISNIAVACSSCSRGVRVGFRVEGKKKTRFCKRCKNTI